MQVGGHYVGWAPEGLSGPCRVLAAAHADHPCDSAGETGDFRVSCDAVHLPQAAELGRNGWAHVFVWNRSDTAALLVSYPTFGLALQYTYSDTTEACQSLCT